MPIPEPKTEPQAEAERTAGQTLFIVPWQDDELVRRESLAPIGDIRREILPFGGLKVMVGGGDRLEFFAYCVGDFRE